MKLPTPCIVCGFEPEHACNSAGEPPRNQPYAATAFTTRGHYGSTVFDTLGDGAYLEINVCDKCMVAHKDRILIGSDREPIHAEAEMYVGSDRFPCPITGWKQRATPLPLRTWNGPGDDYST